MTGPIDLRRVLRDRRDDLASAVARLRARAGRAPALATPAADAAPLVGPSELQQRRDRLARQLAELQWDLGGLAYEMAIRDHFRVDVLVRAAAALQAVDVELAETERLLRLDEAGASGACPSCAALHARGAAFCWRCGAALLAHSSAADASVVTTPTTVTPNSTGAAPASSA